MKHNYLTLVLVVLMSLVSNVVSAHDFEVGGIYYNITSSTAPLTVAVTFEGAYIFSYDEYTGNVTIPATVTYNSKTYSVTSIGANAFGWCSGLTSVTIGNCVTSIGGSAFSCCSGLTSINIPNSVTSIGEAAFYGCSGLTSVTIPNNVTSIGNSAFLACSNLTSITIPNSVISIGEEAFSFCSGLTSITIPNSVISIGSEAFSGCSGMTSVTIPNSVTSIGSDAFAYCSGLTKAEFASIESLCNIKFYASNSNPLDYAHHLYIDGEEVTDLIIPNSVTKIGNYAFEYCSNLTSVTIPNSVISIGDEAFYGCNGLTSVTIPNSVTSIGVAAFFNCYFATDSFINNSALSDSNYWGATIVDEETSDGLLIKNNVLVRCRPSAISATIPNDVTSIGEGAFSSCKVLKSVTIPNSVISIGEEAFRGCSGLTLITIPNSVTSIGSNAFSSCSSLTSVTIPNSVTSIGSGAFSGCSGLTKAEFSSIESPCSIQFSDYDANPLAYAHHLYIDGTEVTNVAIPNSVTSISSYAFYSCEGLTSLTIPESVTSIGEDAFFGCTGLTKLTIEPRVAYEGYDVTDNISSYEERKKQWVWDTSKNAWYVLNNKQEYEEYGVYGTDKETWYDGKLAIVDEHEWEYSGGKWNDLGKTTDTQVVEYIERNSDNTGHIDLGVTFKANTKIQLKYYPTNAGGRAILGDWNTNDNDDWRIFFAGSTLCYDFDSSRQSTSKSINTLYEWEIGNYYIRNIGSTSNILSGTAHTDFSNRTHNILLGTHGGSTNGDEGTDYGRVYYVKIYEGETLVKDFVPYFDGTAYGLWDNISKKAYIPTGEAWTGEKTGTLEYPKYYVEKETPYIVPSLSINHNAFNGCSGLVSVTINSNSVASKGYTSSSTLGSIFGSQVTNYIFGEDVKRIGEYACYNCSKLTSVTIPNNVTSIGENAFKGCTGLTSITIPHSVTSIGKSAFQYCTGLTKAEFASIESFCNIQFGNTEANPLYYTHYLFIDGNEVKDVVLPNGLTAIDNRFQGCVNITNLTIPNSVISIDGNAFKGCSGLTSVTIPNSVTSIGNGAFGGCSGLASVTINSNAIASKSYSSSSTLANIFGSQVKAYVFGNNVKGIGNYALYNSDLKSVIIGTGVLSIGANAFNKPTKVIWLTNTPPSSYKNARGIVNYVPNDQYTSLENTTVYPYLSSMFEVGGVIYVPVSPSARTCDAIDCIYDGSTKNVSIGQTVLFKGVAMNVKEVRPYALYQNIAINDLQINNQGSVGDNAFYGCSGLTSLVISNQGDIGSKAFYGCTGLTSLAISNQGSIRESAFAASSINGTLIVSNTGNIGQSAFSGITGFFTADLNNTGNIDTSVFKGSTGLTVLDVNSNVTDLSSEAFSGCGNLTSAKLQNKGIVGDKCFQSCSQLQTATLGDCITSLGQYAFDGCKSLQQINIPDSVTSIGMYAFQNCLAMTSAQIGQSVQSIGAYAFKGNYALPTITIPKSVTSIGNYTFQSCTALREVIMDEMTSEISLGSNGSSPLFADCPLDSVFIGRNISYPTSSGSGYSPFYRNTSLRSIHITNVETEVPDNEFYGCTNLKNVRLGDGITKIGKWAFSGCSSLDYFLIGNSTKEIGQEAFSDCIAMTRFISRAPEPPTCGATALDDINKWECTLEVPVGSLTAYQNANQWKEFFFMEEGMTGLSAIDNGELKIDKVYDFSGRKLSKMQRGVNIVRMKDGMTKKVLIK